MIQLQGIERVYEVGASPVRALRGVNLSIARGDYVSIMGPSGSGKSTLLHILGCLDRPTAGSYRLAGHETADLPEAELSRVRRHQIGFIFQFFHLIPRLTAAGNIELPMVFAGIPAEERRERARRSLEVVGLTARAGHRPDQLSGGEQQRVAIARAVVMEPAVLLADEPTGNLDSVSGSEVVRLIERMNTEGLTLIVVTHDPQVGGRARRCIRLADGLVVEDTEPPSRRRSAAPAPEVT